MIPFTESHPFLAQVVLVGIIGAAVGNTRWHWSYKLAIGLAAIFSLNYLLKYEAPSTQTAAVQVEAPAPR